MMRMASLYQARKEWAESVGQGHQVLQEQDLADKADKAAQPKSLASLLMRMV